MSGNALYHPTSGAALYHPTSGAALYQNGWWLFGDGAVWGIEGGDIATPVSPGAYTPIAFGYEVALSTKADGTLWGSGANGYGELGQGDVAAHSGRVQIPPYDEEVGPVTVIGGAVAEHSTYYIRADGTLWAAGNNRSGELGDGTLLDRTTHVRVGEALGHTDVVSVQGGYHIAVYLRANGELWGMGESDYGELGVEDDEVKTPVLVATGVSQFSINDSGEHLLFTKTAEPGVLYGLGDGGAGQLGRATYDGDGSTAVPVVVATGVASFSAGNEHTLYVTAAGDLYGLGAGGGYQLGSPDTNDVPDPRLLATGVSSAFGASYRSFWITTDGSLFGVGGNWSKQTHPSDWSDIQTPLRIASGGVTSVVDGYQTTAFFGGSSSPEVHEGTEIVTYYGTIITLAEAASVAYGKWIYKHCYLFNDGEPKLSIWSWDTPPSGHWTTFSMEPPYSDYPTPTIPPAGATGWVDGSSFPPGMVAGAPEYLYPGGDAPPCGSYTTLVW